MNTLGLDLGTNSIGWALIDLNNQKIVDLGVRIFPEGLKNLGQGDKEESKMASRRTTRGMRRQYDRRKRRKQKLQNWLKKNLYWPPDSKLDEFLSLDPYKLRKQALERSLTSEELARALYQLNQHRGFKSNGNSAGEETAATLYKGKKDTGMIGILESESAMEGFQTYGSYLYHAKTELMQKTRSRYTLRAWFEDEFDKIMESQTSRSTNLFTEGQVKELKDIIFFQRDLKDQSDLIGECKFEEGEKRAPKGHPLAEEFVIWHTINNIEVHPVDTLKGKRPLTAEERDLLFFELIQTKDLKTDQISKKIKLDKRGEDNWTTNFKSQKTIKGSAFRAHIKKQLKVKLENVEDGFVDDLWNDINKKGPDEFVAYAEKAYKWEKEKAIAVHDYSAPKGYLELSIKAIQNILPFMRKGQKYNEAMKSAGYEHNLYDSDDKKGEFEKLPSDWLVEEHNDNGKISRVPKINNPIVFAGLWELRKLVNELIDLHGKPDRIHIEMAREVKGNKTKRQEWSNKRDQNYTRNEEAREALKKEFGLSYPTRSQLLRYNLWKEQGGKCLYSGENIKIGEILNDTRVQVDHILPYSRFKQDGYMNKGLCFASENAEKGNRTPMEWLKGNQKFENMMANASKLPEPKQAKLTLDLENEDKKESNSQAGFTENKLVDTSYLMKKAMEYLSYVVPKQHIWGVKGQYTAAIRDSWFPNKNKLIQVNGKEIKSAEDKEWFLENPILENVKLHPEEVEKTGKNRLDHRHHTLDALVIACTSQQTIKQMVLKDGGLRKDVKFILPWENFVADVKEELAGVITSYKMITNNNGQFHKETYYGEIQLPDNMKPKIRGHKDVMKSGKVQVYRIDVTQLNGKQIADIVDNKVRELVIERIRKFSPDFDPEAKGKKGKIPKEAWQEPLFHKDGKTLIKKARVAFNKPAAQRLHRHNPREDSPLVMGGKNHHYAFYKNLDTEETVGEIVSLWDVMDRIRARKPIIDTIGEPDLEFLFSLRINELVIFDPASGEVTLPDRKKYKDERYFWTMDDLPLMLQDKMSYKYLYPYIFRVQKMTDGQLFFKHHSLSKLTLKYFSEEGKEKDDDGIGRVSKSPSGINSCRKLKITPAGQLFISNT